MRNLCFTVFIFLLSLKSVGQKVNVEIVTKNNDTIKDCKIEGNYSFQNLMIMEFQNKLTVYNTANKKKQYLPSEVKSFSFINIDKRVEFVSIEDNIFGLLLYSNKLKLFKVIQPGYAKVNFFVVQRPNNGKTSYMEAMGLSRLVSKKVITREINDCPVTLEKVENRTLKINGVEGVIELIKSYELDCF
ncbi:hypothetical protein [Flavobacterium poyangense]|uniref:hypothetical protein n=1 Tax=Flavobacterium poyangense TaxID=2204302 RepID=UPI00142286F0|nr:hypothetical protein [Flavobacterium sp. JXAS1]